MLRALLDILTTGNIFLPIVLTHLTIPPDLAAVHLHVLECLRRLLPGDVPSLDDTRDPIEDLGLESLDGINFIVLLGTALQHDFPAEFNPFLDSAGHSRTIGQIVESICRKLPSGSCKSVVQPIRP